MFLSELDDNLLESAAKKYQENSEYIDEDVPQPSFASPSRDASDERGKVSEGREKDWRKRSFLRSVDEL